MTIDKRTISRPISMLSATADPPAEMDTRTPRQKVVDVIVSRVRQVDNYNRGVDLDHIRPMCEQDLDEGCRQTVRDAGGWSAFTLANTDGKRMRSFREGSRIIIMPGPELEMPELVVGIKDIMDREAGVGQAVDSERHFVASKVKFAAPTRNFSIRPSAQETRGPGTGVVVDKTVKLMRRNEEVLEVLPKLLEATRLEFFKDQARQDAMRFMRAMTLLMRFRDIFAGRPYAAIITRLEEEGDVKRLGGIDQLLGMGVRCGFLEAKVKEGTVGHVATSKGAALIHLAEAEEEQEEEKEGETEAEMVKMTLLQQQLEENYQSLKPTRDSDRVRSKIVRDIQSHLDRAFPHVGLAVELFGSSGTGLYFPGSDSDMCAYYTTMPPPATIDIRQLGNSLRRLHWCSNVFTVAFAKVPVVKLVHTPSGLPIDISIENTIAIENTRLIKLYMDLDGRVRPLAFALKVWCKSRSISHPEEGTLSSYSWTLLLIHFLQRTSPPVLPNVQAFQEAQTPFTHSYDGDVIDCYYDENATFTSRNTDSMAALWHGFFEYFSRWDFETLVVNIQPVLNEDGIEEHPLRKSEKGRADWQNKAIAIQDPFIEKRNTGVGCSAPLAQWTFQEIRRAERILKNGGSFADMVTFICR